MSHALLIVAVDAKTEADIEQAVAEQMAPFDEGSEWFKDGSRWDWYQIGGRFSGRFSGRDYARRSEISQELLIAEMRERMGRTWDKLIKEPSAYQKFSEFDPSETRESYVNRTAVGFSAYAFLRNMAWHENERMGWFGVSAATECEIKDPDYKGRCLHRDPETEAKIIVYDDARWKERYWPRFIETLPGYTWLVAVDYHV